jgi:transcriptional regulator with XRE-family HTH domain
MTIGDKVRHMRAIKGLSQENMADMLGISVNAFAKIERGETDVNHSRLEQIAGVLQVPLPELVAFGEGQFIYVAGNATHAFTSGTVNNYGVDLKELVSVVSKLDERLKTVEQKISDAK